MYDNNGNKYPIVKIHEFGDGERPLITLEPKDFEEFNPYGEFDWAGIVTICCRANKGFRVICSMDGYPFVDCDIRGYKHLLKFMVLVVKKIKINVDVYPYKERATIDNLLFTGRYENGHCILRQFHKEKEKENNKITIEVDPLVLHDLHFSVESTLRSRKAYLERITLAVNPREASDEEIRIEEKRIEVLEETLADIKKAYDKYHNKEN